MRLERLETLLWERIDGVISAEDEGELMAFLAEDNEARELELELITLAKRLARVREVVPPHVLRERISKALAAARVPEAQGRTPTVMPVRSPVRWGPRVLATAASLLVGVAIGLLLDLGGGRPVDESKAAGAIYVADAREAPVGWEMVLGGGVGKLEARRSDNELSVEVRLGEEHEVVLHVDAESGALEITGVRGEGGGADEVLAHEGVVVVRATGPASTGVALSCSDRGAPVRVVVSLDGERVAERWLGPAEKEVDP